MIFIMKKCRKEPKCLPRKRSWNSRLPSSQTYVLSGIKLITSTWVSFFSMIIFKRPGVYTHVHAHTFIIRLYMYTCTHTHSGDSLEGKENMLTPGDDPLFLARRRPPFPALTLFAVTEETVCWIFSSRSHTSRE